MTEFIKDWLSGILEDIKRAYLSMTIWVNGVVMAALGALPYAQESFPQIQDYVSPEFYKHAMLGIIVANILLRFKTTKPLRDK